MTIRLLVTGFEPFPGAPVNPTAHLIRHFQDNPPASLAPVESRFAVLPVDYARTVPALEEAVAGFEPDVAVHFGLSGRAAGFRLERLARNEIASGVPDNAGTRPQASVIREGGDHVASSLPLDRIASALEAEGHTVEWSDDAGGYLCNYVFYHSSAGLCRGVRARLSGFVHVGHVALPGVPADQAVMDFRNFAQGAELILQTCLAEARGE